LSINERAFIRHIWAQYTNPLSIALQLTSGTPHVTYYKRENLFIHICPYKRSVPSTSFVSDCFYPYPPFLYNGFPIYLSLILCFSGGEGWGGGVAADYVPDSYVIVNTRLRELRRIFRNVRKWIYYPHMTACTLRLRTILTALGAGRAWPSTQLLAKRWG
jgi:hypothetical protein